MIYRIIRKEKADITKNVMIPSNMENKLNHYNGPNNH